MYLLIHLGNFQVIWILQQICLMQFFVHGLYLPVECFLQLPGMHAFHNKLDQDFQSQVAFWGNGYERQNITENKFIDSTQTKSMKKNSKRKCKQKRLKIKRKHQEGTIWQQGSEAWWHQMIDKCQVYKRFINCVVKPIEKKNTSWKWSPNLTKTLHVKQHVSNFECLP